MYIRIFLILLFSATLGISHAQNFEGVITYQASYKSKLPNVTDDQLTAMMGSTMDYAIKGGSYKTSTNGSFFQWQIYRNTDNKLYNKMANSETLLWVDGSVNNDEFVKAEVKKNAVDILGYRCDELTLTFKNSTQIHYFNSKVGMDVTAFEKLTYSGWSEVITRTKAVPLKMIVDVPQYKVECIATGVKPMKLDDSLFDLPAGSKSEKSPY